MLTQSWVDILEDPTHENAQVREHLWLLEKFRMELGEDDEHRTKH